MSSEVHVQLSDDTNFHIARTEVFGATDHYQINAVTVRPQLVEH